MGAGTTGHIRGTRNGAYECAHQHAGAPPSQPVFRRCDHDVLLGCFGLLPTPAPTNLGFRSLGFARERRGRKLRLGWKDEPLWAKSRSAALRANKGSKWKFAVNAPTGTPAPPKRKPPK